MSGLEVQAGADGRGMFDHVEEKGAECGQGDGEDDPCGGSEPFGLADGLCAGFALGLGEELEFLFEGVGEGGVVAEDEEVPMRLVRIPDGGWEGFEGGFVRGCEAVLVPEGGFLPGPESGEAVVACDVEQSGPEEGAEGVFVFRVEIGFAVEAAVSGARGHVECGGTEQFAGG